MMRDMRALFFRCNSGHLFRNGSCPFDGWTHEKVAFAEQLFADNPTSGIQDLIDAGVPDELATDLVIVECMFLASDVEGVRFKTCI